MQKAYEQMVMKKSLVLFLLFCSSSVFGQWHVYEYKFSFTEYTGRFTKIDGIPVENPRVFVGNKGEAIDVVVNRIRSTIELVTNFQNYKFGRGRVINNVQYKFNENFYLSVEDKFDFFEYHDDFNNRKQKYVSVYYLDENPRSYYIYIKWQDKNGITELQIKPSKVIVEQLDFRIID
jgi:hypothetical protein